MSTTTGITTLPPEILLQITGYLDSRKDVHSLLSTCKYLYSIAYRELWSVLRFGRGINRWHLSGSENWQRFIWRAGIKRLLQTIEESENSELPGFEFTRSLVLNFNLSAYSSEPDPDNSDLLSTFLETAIPKMLGLNRIALNLDNYIDLEGFRKDRGRLCDILKEYLHSKSPQEFSMAIVLDGSDGTDAHLRPDRMYTMLWHFDLAKLTSLELRLGLRNRWVPNRWETPEDRSKASYLGLTGLSGNALAVVAALTRIFRATVRLKRLQLFCIPWLSRPGLAYQWFSVNEIAGKLSEFQAVFNDLHSLQSLYFEGVIFHSDLFIAPPKNVTRFRIKGPLPIPWWKQFAEWPLGKVEDLTIERSSSRYSGWEAQRSLNLKYAMLPALQRFGFSTETPRDLIDCLLNGHDTQALRFIKGRTNCPLIMAPDWALYARSRDKWVRPADAGLSEEAW